MGGGGPSIFGSAPGLGLSGRAGIIGRYEKKVFVPTEEYPHINFLGILLGPKGVNQKSMERDTGCRILLKGRGASKRSNSPVEIFSSFPPPETKRRCGGAIYREFLSLFFLPQPDESPLHAFVQADSEETLQRGIAKVHEEIKKAISATESLVPSPSLALFSLARSRIFSPFLSFFA